MSDTYMTIVLSRSPSASSASRSCATSESTVRSIRISPSHTRVSNVLAFACRRTTLYIPDRSDWPTEGLIVGGGTGASETAGSGVYGECGAMSDTVMNHGPSPAFVFRKSSAWPVTYVSSQPSGFTTPSFVRNDRP